MQLAHLNQAMGRRALLKSLAGFVLAFASGTRIANAEVGSPSFASGVRFGEDRHALMLIDADGKERGLLELSDRAHGVAAAPGRSLACVFARRPGTWFHLFDPAKVTAGSVRVIVPPSRRAVGHGTFSRDGNTLFVAENDFDGQRGVIAVYDVTDPRRVRRVTEFYSGGIGPHEITRVDDTDLLVVANGGIATHPDTGREKLNLDTMDSVITVIETSRGRRAQTLARFALPNRWQKTSLRHLVVTNAGRLWVGGQHEGVEVDAPLVTTALLQDAHGAATAIPLVTPPKLESSELSGLNGYVSSVATNNHQVAVSSAPGGRVLMFDAHTGLLTGAGTARDAAGLAFLDSAGKGDPRLRVSDGFGGIHAVGVHSGELYSEPRAHHKQAFDNHLYRVS